MMYIRSTSGQGGIAAIPFIIALILVAAGVWLISAGAPGLGLILIGVGAIIGGFGGTLELGYGSAAVGGTAGFVLIIAGIILRTFFGTG